jgi:predicted amidohydrolase YtcJ
MISGPADLIVLGGTIHTADERAPAAAAFAVHGDRFSYVGSAAGALALRGPQTSVLDVRDCTVLPGFVDAHLHLTNLGLRLQQADLGAARSWDEVVARTVAFARTIGSAWILGRGWDQNLWPERDFPVHEALSAAIRDRPVALARIDGHALLVNACAMRICGVDRSTPDPLGGRIVRAENGAPTGLFIDAAQALIYQRLPKRSHESLVGATRAAIAECNRWGITAVAEPGCDEDVLAAHVELLERGEYSIRNYAMLHDDASLIERRARRGIVNAAYGGRLWVRAIKLYADGALGSRGAALLAPYSDDSANRGLVLTRRERIEDVTARGLENGFQTCVHAIGDRANRMVLDAYAAARRRVGNSEARLRIEHAQVLASEDIARFAALGVIASVQASHAVSDMDWAEARLGPQRSRGAYAWRSLLDAGAIVANGTDAPVEAVSTPRTFHASIARRWHPEERMSRPEALASMTVTPAYANFAERLIGSIAPGKCADFVVIDRDWLEVAPEAILQTEILTTYFAGRQVYGARKNPDG